MVNKRVLAWALWVAVVTIALWAVWMFLVKPEKPPGPGPSAATQAAIKKTDNAAAAVQATVKEIKANRPKHDKEVAQAREEAIKKVEGLDPRAVADRLNAHLARFRGDPIYPGGNNEP